MQQPYYNQESKAGINAYLIPALMVAHLVAFTFSVTSDNFPSKSFAFVVLGVLFSCLASCITLLYSKSNVPKVIAFFIVATCTLKLPLCLIVPETTFLEVLPLKEKLLAEVVCAKFFWFSLGFLGFAFGAIIASRFFWNMSDPNKRDVRMALPERGFILLLILYATIQSMRAYLLLVEQIGAPNVAGRELLIPKLAGILNILGTRGLLIVTVGLMAWALSRRSFLALIIASCAALGYAGVEMAGGWRSGLYFYALCGSWVFLAAEPSKMKSRLKPFAIGFVTMSFLLFIPVMDFRHSLNAGMTQSEAFRAVLEGRQGDERDLAEKFHKIVRRFNGIDLYMTASYGSEDQKLGFMSLFNGAASNFFTFGILGTPEEAVTTQGITLWGSISIALGDQWLAFAGFVAGAVVGGLPILCRRWFHTPVMRSVYESTVTITLLGVLMGNGAFMLYSKELLIGFLVTMLFKFVAASQPAPPAYYPQGQMHYPQS